MYDPTTYIPTDIGFPLPPRFDITDYLEIERELWMLFPETDGKRVNFAPFGGSCFLLVESDNQNEDLDIDESYFLTPCIEGILKMVRMRMLRRLTLSEYRMSALTSLKLNNHMKLLDDILARINTLVIGSGVIEELKMLGNDE